MHKQLYLITGGFKQISELAEAFRVVEIHT